MTPACVFNSARALDYLHVDTDEPRALIPAVAAAAAALKGQEDWTLSLQAAAVGLAAF